MNEGGIATRWSVASDEEGLAGVHGASWRYAYAGIIPGLTLERMLARRGPGWWTRMHARGNSALVIEAAGQLAGYATLGRSRALGGRTCGEIYELYVAPEYQGCGIGRRLFEAGRSELTAHGLDRLLVWALAENSIACRFYRAMGGVEAARSVDRFSGVRLAKIGFSWS